MKNKDLKIPLVIGVTGHRDIPKEDFVKLEEKIEEIFRSLEIKYPTTPFILLSALADGADRLVAKVVLSKFKDKVSIKVPLPFDEDTYKTTFGVDNLITNEESIIEYDELLENIEKQEQNTPLKILMAFDKEKYNNLGNKDKREIRHKQYSLLGEYVAIHSHILIALEDPKSIGKVGGTSEVVIKKLNGEYEFFGEKDDVSQPEKGIVYRIFTPRLISKNSENNDKYKIQKLFPNSDIPFEWENEEIDRYSLKDFIEHLFSKPCLSITQKEKYNSYRQQHIQINCLNKMIEDNLNKIEKKVEEDKRDFIKLKIKDKNILQLVSIRRAIAEVSRKYQSKMQYIEKILLILIVLTTTIVLIKSTFPESIQSFLTIFYPLVVILFYIEVTHFKNYKNIYEDSRAISEGLRVQIAWNIGKINESVALNYLARQKDELNWIRSSLRTMNIFNPQNKSKVENTDKEKVCNYWIEEQISYFSINISKYSKIVDKSTNTINLLFIMFISLYISFFIFTNMYEGLNTIKQLFMAIPLVLLAWLKSKQLFDGHGKTIKQYELSLESFKRARTLLSRKDTNHKEIIKKLGREALFENSFWTILRREKNYKTPSL